MCWNFCGVFVCGGGWRLLGGRVDGRGCRGSVLARKGVWVCVCGLKYPGFDVFYFNFLYNY